jgi:hypothetical protein
MKRPNLRARRARATVLVLGLSVLVTTGALGCKRESRQQPSSVASPPSDRLGPTETLPGRPTVFGIEVPLGMEVSANLGDVVHLSGRSSVAQLVAYFRKHVAVANIELTEHGAVFPRAYINDDPKKRLYRIDIKREGNGSLVRMRDVTPTPAVQGLSESERWQRAGLNPDGSLKDRLKTY